MIVLLHAFSYALETGTVRSDAINVSVCSRDHWLLTLFSVIQLGEEGMDKPQDPCGTESTCDFICRLLRDTGTRNMLQDQPSVVRDIKATIKVGEWTGSELRSASMHELVDRIDAAITNVTSFEPETMTLLDKLATDIRRLAQTEHAYGIGRRVIHAFPSSLLGPLMPASHEDIMTTSFINYVDDTVPRPRESRSHDGRAKRAAGFHSKRSLCAAGPVGQGRGGLP